METDRVIKQIWTCSEMAAVLGIGERAVRTRGKRDNWGIVHNKTLGGLSNGYIYDSFPADVKLAALKYNGGSNGNGESESAGAARGLELMEETALAQESERLAKENSLADFNALPDCRKKEAAYRLEILKARDAFINAAGLQVKYGSNVFCREVMAGAVDLGECVIDMLRNGNGRVSLSWPSLARWHKAYREKGLYGLARRNENLRKSSVPTHMQRFIMGMKVERPHVTLAMIMQGLCARFDGQAIPHTSSVRRWVQKWEAKHESLMLFIRNPDEWKSKRMFATGSASENIMRLNQLWEMDSTPTDVMLTDGRHALIGVIDVYSRRFKLLVSPTSKGVAISALIRRAMLDWGVPEVIKTDNGKDYVSNHILYVLDALEIDQYLCDPFTPEQKPHVERAFGTFAHSIVELLPGFIGHNVAQRKAIEARRSFAQKLMKQGSDPVEIKMTAQEFQDICDRWVDAMYHQNPHSSLDGKTPALAAREWIEPIRKIQNERALDLLLSPAPTDGGYRTIRKKGVDVEGLFYSGPEMAGHEGERVHVFLDKTDLGAVYVYRTDETGEREFLCQAIDPVLKGIDRAKHAKMMKKRQTEKMNKGRKEYEKIAKAESLEEIGQEILAYNESKIANIAELPKRFEDYTTPALNEAGRAVSAIEQRATGPHPIDITPEEETIAKEVIDLAARKKRPLPVNDWEKYEMLLDDFRAGVELSDTNLAWMKRYELYLEKGTEKQWGLRIENK